MSATQEGARPGPRLAVGRRALTALALLLLPLPLYSSTILARFGFRDDYSILRESHEEPGKVLRWCASEGRPLYGGVLEWVFAHVPGIDGLWQVRMLSALFVGALCALCFLALRRAGLREAHAAAFAALLAVLPAAQVDVSWAICFPHLLAGIAGLAGFLVCEGGGAGRRLLGCVLVACGALFYQPHGLFYLVPVACGLVVRRDEPIGGRLRWLAPHGAALAAGLMLAFAIVTLLFATHALPPSRLWAFEADPWFKLGWFVQEPLRNALALVVLRDARHPPSFAHVAIEGMVALSIAAGVVVAWRRGGWRSGAFWLLCVPALALASFAANLVSFQHWSTYRTIWVLTGVCLAFVGLPLGQLADRWPRAGRWLAPALFAGIALLGAPLARSQAYDLIAVPQQVELSLIEEGAREAVERGHPAVFVIRPTMDDAPAPEYYADEFGSLSTDSEWTPVEMLKLLLGRHFPKLCEGPRHCAVSAGRNPPRGDDEIVIDMRRLRRFRSVEGQHPSLLKAG